MQREHFPGSQRINVSRDNRFGDDTPLCSISSPFRTSDGTIRFGRPWDIVRVSQVRENTDSTDTVNVAITCQRDNEERTMFRNLPKQTADRFRAGADLNNAQATAAARTQDQ